MKDGAILINTPRGGFLNENSVADALISGKLAAAAVDVISKELRRKENPLLRAPNCIITSHISWAPKESRQRLLDHVVENIRSSLAGKLQTVVNL